MNRLSLYGILAGTVLSFASLNGGYYPASMNMKMNEKGYKHYRKHGHAWGDYNKGAIEYVNKRLDSKVESLNIEIDRLKKEIKNLKELIEIK